MSLEYQRYGRNKETTVNHTYIDSGEYRNKFDSITDNISVNRILYVKSKEILKAISGKPNLIVFHNHPNSMPPSIDDLCQKGYSEKESQLKALEKLKRNHDLDFGEVR